ncbi:MAG: hypothetical protein ABIB47_01410 [Candidatus Woesearchaeota archaeon]
MIELLLWQKIVFYLLLLISIFIFVKTSKLKINNVPIIKLRYRILLSLFFPIVLILALVIGSIMVGIIAAAIFILFLSSYFTRKKKYRLQRQVTIKKF